VRAVARGLRRDFWCIGEKPITQSGLRMAQPMFQRSARSGWSDIRQRAHSEGLLSGEIEPY